MTVRKIIERIDFVKAFLGNQQFLGRIQDYLVTIQNNTNNLVLLKDITNRAIADFEEINESEVPEFMEKILVGKERPFTDTNLYQQLIDLKNQNYPEHSSQYSTLNNILTQIQSRVNKNIAELDKIRTTLVPFLEKDYSKYQKENNAIISIVFNNEISFNSLKNLSFELKNWDRGLFLYQQIISDETPQAFEIIEVDEGSIEVIISILLEVGEQLLDLLKTGIEVYAAYLAYKTVVHDRLIKSFKGNPELLKSEEVREKLLLENIRIAVKNELKKQAKITKKAKGHEALEKKIDVVTKLITEHVIKGNSIKLISAPQDMEEIKVIEKEKEEYFIQSRADYKKLDDSSKQLLLAEFITPPPEENYEVE